MAQIIQREPAFSRRKQVETRTGLSRSTIYQYIKDGVFPKPVPLGPRAVGWLESDVGERICRARENRMDALSVAAEGWHGQNRQTDERSGVGSV